MKKTFIYTIFFLVILALHCLFYSQDQESWGIIVDALYLIAPISAFLVGNLLLKNLGTKNLLGFSILFLVLGMLLFSIGEIVWFFFVYVFKIEPYPSLADFFFLGVYPISLVGIILKIRSEKIKWSLWFFKKFLPFIFLLSISAGVVFYYGVYSAYIPEDSLASNVVSMLYGIGDLILIFGCFLILVITIEYKGGKMFSPWILTTLSYSILLVADVLFSANKDAYDINAMLKMAIDVIWMAGYFVFGLGMLNFLEIVQGQQEKIKGKLNLKKNEE
ncbi:MAG: hypothetical protein WAV31_01800 [Candidatus Moraniibacteriota bacterium]